ncbi:MAG: ATP-binding cassette domain-containing protein [Sphingobacteriales bacterium]|nr:MAG: ATP-binding cassette domain-containing protein [Sphingobacteriales bacterium]
MNSTKTRSQLADDKQTDLDTRSGQEWKIDRNEKVVEIQHLAKAFGKNKVLVDLNYDVYRGENLIVLGKSGTGKSVSIKCMVGMLQQDSGNVKVFGDEVSELDETGLRELRIKIGFLFQSGALYDSMTVYDNLAFPLTRVLKLKDKAEIDSRINEMLEGVGLANAVDKMPSDLSGGQRKRIGLARTLILKPEIMLYDEPTTGLDPITSREISQLIREMQKKYNISSIIITHDMECAKITGDRIIVMKEGEVVAEGQFDELANSSDAFVRSFFQPE